MKTMSELYDSIRLTRSAATFTRALGIDVPTVQMPRAT